MKDRLSFLVCLFISIVAQASSEKLAHAASLYNQKHYDQAYDILTSIDSKTAVVWYNIGNCAYKKNDYRQAIACWRCAQANAPAALKDSVAYNLAVAEKKLNKISEKSFWNRACDIYRSTPLIIFQLIFLLSWFLLLLFIKKDKHDTKYKSLLFITIMAAIALGLKYHMNNQQRGIVMKDSISLFAGPNEQYHILDSLEGATHVLVHEQRAPWCKVSTQKNSGWVMLDSIAVIK